MNKKQAIIIISAVTVVSYLLLFFGISSWEKFMTGTGGSGMYTPWVVYLIPGLICGLAILAICKKGE